MTRSPRCSSFFFFNDTATTEIYTLSLHDALPISKACGVILHRPRRRRVRQLRCLRRKLRVLARRSSAGAEWPARRSIRSEEHTSELQSHLNLVCRLLLEKKKNNSNYAV